MATITTDGLYASQKESETATLCIKYTLVLLPGLVVTRAPLVPVVSSRWADVPSSRVPRPWQQDAEEAGGGLSSKWADVMLQDDGLTSRVGQAGEIMRIVRAFPSLITGPCPSY